MPEHGRNPAPLKPMTESQRADVAKWVSLGARLALEASPNLQPADRDEAVSEAYLQMCRSAQTYDGSTSVQNHLGNAARWGAREAYHVLCRGGFAGLKGRPSVADVMAVRPDRVPFGEALGVEMADPVLPDRRELPADVLAAIEALPERLALVVRWRFLEDRTLKDIGRRLKVTAERVRQLVPVALIQLRANLTGVPA